jgi:hypothetical protein
MWLPASPSPVFIILGFFCLKFAACQHSTAASGGIARTVAFANIFGRQVMASFDGNAARHLFSAPIAKGRFFLNFVDLNFSNPTFRRRHSCPLPIMGLRRQPRALLSLGCWKHRLLQALFSTSSAPLSSSVGLLGACRVLEACSQLRWLLLFCASRLGSLRCRRLPQHSERPQFAGFIEGGFRLPGGLVLNQPLLSQDSLRRPSQFSVIR